MKPARLTRAAVAGALCLTAAFPAAAGTPQMPEITDKVGDANGINGQGISGFEEVSPDTRPASIDAADILAVWFRTAYDTTKVRDESGRVLSVIHTPTALEIHFKTLAPVKPTPGGLAMMYRVPADLSTCPGLGVFFQMRLAGVTNTTERADINNFCQGVTLTDSRFTLTFVGSESVWTYPFAAFPTRLVAAGVEITSPAAHVRTFFRTGIADAFTAPAVDEAKTGDDFTIGSDVPPNVDCVATPDHPDCQG